MDECKKCKKEAVECVTLKQQQCYSCGYTCNTDITESANAMENEVARLAESVKNKNKRIRKLQAEIKKLKQLK